MASRTANEFAIRRCTLADAKVLADLAARLFRESYGRTHPEPELSRYLARAFSVDKVRDEIADDDVTMFIAEEESPRPIGYAFLRKTSQLPDGVTNQNSLEIVRFYVETAAQGKGVGAALMDQCFAESRRRGAEMIWVQTWTEAPWAIGFYERMGFKTVGSAEFHFGDRIDADQIMSRDL
ncbi:MAG TPA: GNAT family N-acetyltransferase [Gemmatimonadaceae bacterium]|nr:GNAT family N-acetyltransferase [Gemmatimonadaceae bacterium]